MGNPMTSPRLISLLPLYISVSVWCVCVWCVCMCVCDACVCGVVCVCVCGVVCVYGVCVIESSRAIGKFGSPKRQEQEPGTLGTNAILFS